MESADKMLQQDYSLTAVTVLASILAVPNLVGNMVSIQESLLTLRKIPTLANSKCIS